MPVKAAPANAPLTWTGFHIGATAGSVWGRSQHCDTAAFCTATFSVDGLSDGGTLGYNWQSTNWVLGLEMEFFPAVPPKGPPQRSHPRSASIAGRQIATRTWIGSVRYPLLGFGTPLYTTYGNPFTTKIPIAGVNGGGQIGYNYQFHPMWVAGVEADIQAAGMTGNVSCLLACGTRLIIVSPPTLTSAARVNFSDISAGNKLKWFGTLRGSVGFTGDKNWAWVYLTGGLAYGEVERSGSVSGTSTNGSGSIQYNTFTGAYDNSSIRVGWTIGAGVEGKLMGNWSVKAEYLYVDLGSVTDTFNTIYQTCGNGGCGTPGTVAGVRTDVSKFHENIVRLGLNYRFGG